jgi:hypothetical protein
MGVVLDTHENIEDLSNLMLRQDEEFALARALRIKAISKMVIPADIDAIISDVIRDKLAVCAQVKQEQPYVYRRHGNLPKVGMMTKHRFTRAFRPETREYFIEFLHTFHIDLSNETVNRVISFTNPRKSRALTYEEAIARPDYKDMKVTFGGP